MEYKNQRKDPLGNNEEHWKYNKMHPGQLLQEKNPENSKKGENRFYKFLLSKSIMLIWVLRIERVYKDSQEHSKEEIRARWVSRLNEKLRLDRAATHDKLKEIKTDKDLVLSTWKGSLKNEKDLPEDWITKSGVLVGMESQESKEMARQPTDPD